MARRPTRPLPEAPAAGAIDALFAHLEFEVRPFAICTVAAGCRLRLAPSPFPTLHYVLRGEGVLRIQGVDPIALEPGTAVVTPARTGQHMRAGGRPSGPEAGPARTRCLRSADGLDWVQAESEGSGAQAPALVVVCGQVRARGSSTAGAWDQWLVPLVADCHDDRLLGAAIDTLAHAPPGEPPIDRVLADTLVKLCLLRIVRRGAAVRPAHGLAPWLPDRQLLPAVAAIARDPAAPLSVEELASRVNMSRAAFVRRFTRALGLPPHEYLRRQRLRHAARLLLATGLPVKAVASRAGFRSRSHFSRSFKDLFGYEPARFRRRGSADAEP